MKKIFTALLAVALLAGITVQAQNRLSEAKALYTKGDFKAAADIAKDINTAEAQSFAAKANSIYAYTQPENKQEALYTQSEKYARKAISLDDSNADGYFEIARALGRLSQIRGILAALSQGLGSQIRENLETALRYDTKHTEAMVAFGLWHSEIVAKGVGWLYGASPEAAIGFFDRAVRLEPKTIIHKVEYAHGLLLIDKNKYLQKAKDLLEEAVKLKANDAAEALDLARAKRDLAAL